MILGHFSIGGGYNCPVCDTSFSKMLDGRRDFEVLKKLKVVGGGWVKNNFCPKCNSGYKERLLFAYLSQIKGLFGSEKEVLHIAPEWSLRKKFKKDFFKTYITGDLNSPLVEKK